MYLKIDTNSPHCVVLSNGYAARIHTSIISCPQTYSACQRKFIYKKL